MMRGGWLLSIYRENFVDNIRRSLKKRKKKVKGTKRLELVLSVGLDSAQNVLSVLLCFFCVVLVHCL